MLSGRLLIGPAVPKQSTVALTRELAEKAWLDKHQPPSSSCTKTLEWWIKEDLDAAEASGTPNPILGTVYDQYVRPFKWATKLLGEITAEDLVTIQEQFPKSAGTGRRYGSALHASLARAAKAGHIATAPALTLPKTNWKQQFKRVLSPEERKAFLALPWRPAMRIGVLLMFNGLRGGEARGVRYEDFDGEGILLRRQILSDNGKPKVKQGLKSQEDRWVPVISPDLKKILKSRKKGYVMSEDGVNPIAPWLFRSMWDCVIKGPTIDRKHTRKKPDHPFTDVTPHDLRSTCAMMLLEAGIDLRTSAEILGHDPAMLAQIYARSRKDLKIAAAKKLAI